MANPRHMRGRGARLTVFEAGVQFPPLDVDSWNLKPVKVQVADRVCGEDRDRLDSLIQHYMLSLKCFNQTGEKIKKLLKYDASGDNGTRDDVDAAVKLTDPKGGTLLLAMRDAVIDDWELSNGGQNDGVMVNIPIRGRYVEDL